jgi:uncharacterized protein
VHEMIAPHEASHDAAAQAATDPESLENEKVSGAIRTDVILSAEIMAITLSTVAAASFWTQATVLAVVGVGITAIVYGAVALIVKADDFGVALAKRGGGLKTLGLGIVKAMPVVLKVLSIVGTLAMLWVGGGIIIHSIAGYGLGALEHGIHAVAAGIAAFVKPLAGLTEWLVTATASGVFGLLVGFLVEKAVVLTRSFRKPSSH